MDKRMILPALFGILVLILAAGYASVFLILPVPAVFKLLIGLGIAGLAAAMLFVIVQRKKELKQEDKDDLGQY